MDDDDRDDAKRKSRNLSEKKRRDQFNLLVNELSSMVSSTNRKMDKSTVLKATIAFLKQHNEITVRSRVHEIEVDWKPSFLSNEEFTHLILEALDGFIIVFSSTGQIYYASESITSLLGHLPNDLLGMTIFDLAYEKDHSELRNLLSNPTYIVDPTKNELEQEKQVCFLSHLKKDGLNNRHEVAYELVQFVGYFRNDIDIDDLLPVKNNSRYTNESDSKLLFVGTGRIQTPQLIREMSVVDSTKSEFTSRHSLEWKFLFLDHRATPIIGYLPFEVLGTSGYDYYHYDDLEKVAICHEALMQKGEGTSCYYRFLTKGQQWIWLQTRFYITYHQWNSKPEFVVCTHRIVNYAEILKQTRNRNNNGNNNSSNNNNDSNNNSNNKNNSSKNNDDNNNNGNNDDNGNNTENDNNTDEKNNGNNNNENDDRGAGSSTTNNDANNDGPNSSNNMSRAQLSASGEQNVASEKTEKNAPVTVRSPSSKDGNADKQSGDDISSEKKDNISRKFSSIGEKNVTNNEIDAVDQYDVKSNLRTDDEQIEENDDETATQLDGDNEDDNNNNNNSNNNISNYYYKRRKKSKCKTKTKTMVKRRDDDESTNSTSNTDKPIISPMTSNSPWKSISSKTSRFEVSPITKNSPNMYQCQSYDGKATDSPSLSPKSKKFAPSPTTSQNQHSLRSPYQLEPQQTHESLDQVGLSGENYQVRSQIGQTHEDIGSVPVVHPQAQIFPSYMPRPQKVINSPYIDPLRHLAAIPVQPVLLAGLPSSAAVISSIQPMPELLHRGIVLTSTQSHIQEQLQRKHKELQQLIIQQQEELRRVSEQLLMARTYGHLPPSIVNVTVPFVNQPQSQARPQRYGTSDEKAVGSNIGIHRSLLQIDNSNVVHPLNHGNPNQDLSYDKPVPTTGSHRSNNDLNHLSHRESEMRSQISNAQHQHANDPSRVASSNTTLPAATTDESEKLTTNPTTDEPPV